MKLWVDYTNHRGVREWRHIAMTPMTIGTDVVGLGQPYVTLYPPPEAGTPKVEPEPALCMNVWMYDRDGVRTLNMEHIHGFRYQREKPAPGVVDGFAALRQASDLRRKEWDWRGQLAGSYGLLYRSNELAGEAGEVANKVKKLVRERMGIVGSRTDEGEIASEIADVIICCDLLASSLGEVNLWPIVRATFNATSEKYGLKTRL